MKNAKKLLALFMALLVFSGAAVTSFAAGAEETEPNNSKEEATAYDIEDVATGSLSDAGDVDWYKVTVKNPGSAKVKLTQEGTDVFEVAVYDSADKELVSFTASDENPESSSFTVNPGEYYIKVSAGSVISGVKYTVDFTSFIAENSETEDNNDIASANFIEFKSGTSGQAVGAVSSDDTDWFRFTAITGTFNCEIKKTDDGAGTVKAELIQSKSGSENLLGSVSVSQTGKSAKSADIGVIAGTYYIKVTGSGSYSLTVSTGKVSDYVYETESNDTAQNATSFTIDYKGLVFGSLSHENDVDWFIVTTNETDKNSIVWVEAREATNYAGYNSDSSWTVELLDSNKNTLESKTASTAEHAEFNLANYGAGTYYFKIYAGMKYTSSEYVIKSEKTDPVIPFWQQIWEMLKNSNVVPQLRELIDRINILGVLGSIISNLGKWIIELFK